MRQSCVWSIVALFAILLCLQIANGEQMYKRYEVGGRAVKDKYCGNRIMSLYHTLCSTGNRKRRSMFLDEREALSFFQHQTQRHRRDANPTTNPTTSPTTRTTAIPTTSTGTDVVEECCIEGCAYEEMYEYC